MTDEKEREGEEKEVKAEEETRKKEQQGGKETTIENKKRSGTELDTEDIDMKEITAEEAGKDKESDKPKEAPQKKEVAKKEYIMIVISLLLVLTVVSGVLFVWARYFTSDDSEGLALSVPQGPVYELKPFFVPLNSNAKSNKFLRLTLVLELCDEKSYKQVKRKIEEVRNNIFEILVNASHKKIENIQGQKVLVEKIISIINLLLAEKIVEKVFFKNVVVI